MVHLRPGQWPADGSLPEHVQEFIEWKLSMDKDPPNTKQWATANGVSYGTVQRWMKDTRVLTELDRRANELNMRPDHIQEVINAVWKSAKGGDMQAAKLYLQHCDRLAPKRKVLTIEDERIEALSDADFKAELEKHGLNV